MYEKNHRSLTRPWPPEEAFTQSYERRTRVLGEASRPLSTQDGKHVRLIYTSVKGDPYCVSLRVHQQLAQIPSYETVSTSATES